MSPMPAPLAALIEELEPMDRTERTETLVDYADRFREVPSEVAKRPFDERHRIPHCESEGFVWAVDRPDGTLQFHFAVENPQGVSAKAWAMILDETLSGQPLDQVAAVPAEALYKVFGRELSMGKGLGLTGMLEMVAGAARQKLQVR